MAGGRSVLPAQHWHRDNRFLLLTDGDRFFPRMLSAIAAARRQVLLEIYLFESGRVADRFISALSAAAARGVDVRIMIDAFGSLALSSPDRETLRRAGAQLHVYNPLQVLGDRLRNLMRDHRKLLVIDGATAFVGGAGITDDFSPAERPKTYWRETMLEIRGPVVHDWSRLFLHAWINAGNAPFKPMAPPARRGTNADASTWHQAGRLAIAHGPAVQNIKDNAFQEISTARQRVWLETPYFVPSMRLRKELLRAAHRGVDVRLILPGTRTDHPVLRLGTHHYYARLLRHGIRIFEYQPRFIHSKTLLVDDWVSIGSCNFDRWNLRWNLEANQEVRDGEFAQEVAAMLAKDIGACIEINADAWAKRLPVLSKIEAGLARAGQALERYLDRQ